MGGRISLSACFFCAAAKRRMIQTSHDIFAWHLKHTRTPLQGKWTIHAVHLREHRGMHALRKDPKSKSANSAKADKKTAFARRCRFLTWQVILFKGTIHAWDVPKRFHLPLAAVSDLHKRHAACRLKSSLGCGLSIARWTITNGGRLSKDFAIHGLQRHVQKYTKNVCYFTDSPRLGASLFNGDRSLCLSVLQGMIKIHLSEKKQVLLLVSKVGLSSPDRLQKCNSQSPRTAYE